ncbi:MAG: hypothetical protein ACE5EJ_06985 [Nitrosopumilaceae archaeon]
MSDEEKHTLQKIQQNYKLVGKIFNELGFYNKIHFFDTSSYNIEEVNNLIIETFHSIENEI